MPQLKREVNRVICPILDNHACTDYLHWPVLFRASLSTSLQTCWRTFLQGLPEPFTPTQSPASLLYYIVHHDARGLAAGEARIPQLRDDSCPGDCAEL
jgi:hypothetical protein